MYPLCRDKTICDQLEEHPTLYQEAAIMSLQRPDSSRMSLERAVIWLVAALSDSSKSLPLMGFSVDWFNILLRLSILAQYTDKSVILVVNVFMTNWE